MKSRYLLSAIAGPLLALAIPSSHVAAAPLLCQDESGPNFLSSLPPTAPAVIGWNSLDVHVAAMGFPSVEFSGVPVPVPGSPTWHALPSTPLGPVLLVPLDESVGSYLIAFLNPGITLPIDWDFPRASFVGTNGPLSVSVKHTALEVGGQDNTQQGPGGPCVDIKVTEVPRPGGNKGIRIAVDHPAECTVSFYQFFSQRITYGEGGICGLPLPGTVGGTGNNGVNTSPNDDRVYTDSALEETPDGTYRASPPIPIPGSVPPSSTTAMEDGPEALEDQLGAVCDWITQRNGANVNRIDIEMRFTTYVMLTCPPAAPDIVGKVEWSYRRTYRFPPPGGQHPDGELGGPCPIPGATSGFPNSSASTTVGAGQVMDPDHSKALDDYKKKIYEGAPRTPDGW